MTLESEVRRIVRDELGRLLGPEAEPATRAISDIDRQRAVAALRRVGVPLGPVKPSGRGRRT